MPRSRVSQPASGLLAGAAALAPRGGALPAVLPQLWTGAQAGMGMTTVPEASPGEPRRL